MSDRIQTGKAGVLFPAPLPGGLFVGYFCPLDDDLMVRPITNYWMIPGTECEGFTAFEEAFVQRGQHTLRF